LLDSLLQENQGTYPSDQKLLSSILVKVISQAES